MKKELIIYTILAVILIVSLSVIGIFLNQGEIRFSPIEYAPPIPEECTDEEITFLWDYTFKETSHDIKIHKSEETAKCTFLAVKTNGSTFYVLNGENKISFSEENKINTKSLKASKGNGTSEYLNTLKNITNVKNLSLIYNSANPSLTPIDTSSLTGDSIKNTSKAKEEFESTFKIATGSWKNQSTREPYHFNFTDERFITQGENKTEMKTKGFVYQDKKLSYTSYISISSYGTACISNWTELKTTCRKDDTILIYYNDTSSCPEPTETPKNKTIDCDYKDNKIIGSKSDIENKNLEIEIFIGAFSLNESKQYNETKKVEIKENGRTIIEFSHDFDSNTLNLKDVKIEKQPQKSEFGYLIIEGLPYSKKAFIDKLNSSSKHICIRDRNDVNDIDDFTSECTPSSEALLECPGSGNGFTCKITNSQFEVSGLTKTAVKEFLTPPEISTPPNTSSNSTSTACTESWECTDWSDCNSGKRTRSCTDSNSCNTTNTKPSEEESCTEFSPCVEDWDCTEWRPEKCPKDERQTRVCTDLNSCGTANTLYPEERTCKYENKGLWITAIVLLTILILATLSAIIYIIVRTYLKNKKLKEEDDILGSL